MLRVFLGDGRKPLDQKHPCGKKEPLFVRSAIGLQKKEARLRRLAPDRYALPPGKSAGRSPHQNRDGGANDVAPRPPGAGMAGSAARPQSPAPVQNRLDFYHFPAFPPASRPERPPRR